MLQGSWADECDREEEEMESLEKVLDDQDGQSSGGEKSEASAESLSDLVDNLAETIDFEPEDIIERVVLNAGRLGVVDVNAIGANMREMLRQEHLRVTEEVKQKKKREREKALREKRREKRMEVIAKQKKKMPHMMVTRRKVPDLLNKEDLTPPERRLLNDRFGKNRCNVCSELKDLDCFYRMISDDPMKTQYRLICIACENLKYNERSERRAFTEMLNRCRRRANEKGMEFDLKVSDLEKIFAIQKGRCNYTGRPLTIKSSRNYDKKGGRAAMARNAYHTLGGASVDRMDPSRGYVRDNIHLVSIHINFAKLDLTQEDFLALCHDVVHVSQLRGGPPKPPLLCSDGESPLPETALHPL